MPNKLQDDPESLAKETVVLMVIKKEYEQEVEIYVYHKAPGADDSVMDGPQQDVPVSSDAF